MIGIIVALAFLVVMGGAGFLVFKEVKKNNEALKGTVNTNSVENAQDFLPFKDVPTNAIDLGNHHYRMIIETSSTNYKLRTPQEQNIIDMTFQEFLNGLTHPITLYIQTRKLDMTKVLEHIETENVKIIQEFPTLENYAVQYYNEMLHLEDYVGNSIQKKKYIIVPYDEALTMDIPENEKYDMSMKELTARTNNIADNLRGIGISTRILEREEIVELLYYTFHKGESGLADNVIDNYLSTFVDSSRNPLKDATNEEKVDMILYQAQMRVRYEVMKDVVSSKQDSDLQLFERVEQVYKDLTDTRNLFENGQLYYENENEQGYYENNQQNNLVQFED